MVMKKSDSSETYFGGVCESRFLSGNMVGSDGPADRGG